MKKSEQIEQLAAALCKAQAEMAGAKKTAKNPFFKSNYANLEEVIHCIRQPFADNGLSFMQFPLAEEDRAGVETIILHSSGEWISNKLMLKCSKVDPQGMGSAITYARRYGLQAAVGLPSEDDDGNAATGAPKAKAAQGITETQKTNIMSLITKAKFQAEHIVKAINWASSGATEKLDDLSQPEAAKLIGFITKKVGGK